MATEKPIKRRTEIFNKLKHKYRLVFFNDNTFEEVWHLRLSLYNVLSIAGTMAILFIVIVFLTMAFTPLRKYIPGYFGEDERIKAINNSLRLDTLQEKLRIQDQYFANVKALISGEEPVKYENMVISDTASKKFKNIVFTKSIHDSLLRKRIEEEEKYNFSISTAPKVDDHISKMHFFTPVKGIITDRYNAKLDHYGIDIVAQPNEVDKATLDGTVVLATWTLETGHIIQVQHSNNIVSFYKHNASLLQKVGNHVKAGDAIAILGNSGELTTGPHLHFELWYNGKPVNPEEYIIFN